MPALLHTRRAVLPAAFKPRVRLPQTAALLARWSPDDIPAQADNSALASWTDSVGGIALTQATSANRPVYRTGGAGGRPYLSLSGSQGMAVSTSAALAAGLAAGRFTVMVFYRNGVGTTSGVLATMNGGANYIAAASTSFAVGGATYGAGVPSAKYPHDGAIGSSAVQSVAFTQGGGVGGNFHGIALNGCLLSYTASAFGGQNGNFNLGYPTVGASFGGDIYDMLLWSVALMPAEIMQAQKWACDKYAQTPAWTSYGKLLIGAGDSQTAGAGTTTPTIDNYVAKAARSIGMPIGSYMNVGQTGRTTPELDAWAATALDPIPALAGIPANLSYLEYYNIRDVTGPSPGPLNLAFAAGRKAAGFNRIGLLTCLDSYNHPTSRAQYLTDLIAGYAANGVSDLIRIDQNANVGVVGAATTTSGTTYFADGIHPTTAGQAEVQALYQPVVVAW